MIERANAIPHQEITAIAANDIFIKISPNFETDLDITSIKREAI